MLKMTQTVPRAFLISINSTTCLFNFRILTQKHKQQIPSKFLDRFVKQTFCTYEKPGFYFN